MLKGSRVQGAPGNVASTHFVVVTLARDRSGWRALVTSRQERQVAPRLYHTRQVAKAWVEQQLLAALSPSTMAAQVTGVTGPAVLQLA